MFYLQYILTFFVLSTLLLSNIEESSFNLNSIENNKIDLTFEFYPENLSFTKELGDIIFARAHRFSGTGYCNMQPEVITDDKYPENMHEWSGSPDWLPEEWGIEYHRYLNTFSHNINLLRYFFECTPEVEYTSLRDSGSQIVILNFGKFKATLETKNYYDNNWDELTEIFFEHGCLIIETPPQLLKNVAAKIRLFNRKDGSIKTARVPKWSWSFQRQAESYIQDIVKNKSTITTGIDSLEDIRLIENIWKHELKL